MEAFLNEIRQMREDSLRRAASSVTTRPQDPPPQQNTELPVSKKKRNVVPEALKPKKTPETSDKLKAVSLKPPKRLAPPTTTLVPETLRGSLRRACQNQSWQEAQALHFVFLRNYKTLMERFEPEELGDLPGSVLVQGCDLESKQNLLAKQMADYQTLLASNDQPEGCAKCVICKKMNVTASTAQICKADEGSTVFLHCHSCNYRWRQR